MTDQQTIPAVDDIDAQAPITDAMRNVSTSLAAFSTVGAGLAALREKHPVDLVCAVATPAGMKEAIAGRAAWRDPRTELEKMRKAAKAPVLELGKLIDTTAAGLEAQLRIGESNYDDQIQAELKRKADEKARAEETERLRVYAIKEAIARFFTSKPARLFGSTAAQIQEAIITIVAIELPQFAEFAPDAETAKAHALEALRAMHATQLAAEERAAEQARIAAEQAEQARTLAEQRAKFDAEQAAHRAALEEKANAMRAEQEAREAAARKEADAREAAARAEREQIAAEQKALDDAKRAEADRLAAIERKAADDAAAAERAKLAQEAAAKAAKEAKARKAEEARQQAERERLAALAAELEHTRDCGPRLLAALKALFAVADTSEASRGADFEAAMYEAAEAIAEAEEVTA